MVNEINIGEPEATPASAETDAIARERDELYERLLRSAAEFDNFRKRTERERRDWSDAASADVIRDLLPVADDLERALEAASSADTRDPALVTLRRGVELIQRQLLDVLRKRGVEVIGVVGQDFDPTWHEAIANDPLDGRRPGEITAEVRRGYRMGDRLLRPAMVKVANA